MNRSIRHLALGLMACYIALFVMLNLWQVARSQELSDAPDNTRQTLRDFNRPRGPIVTADGEVVARSVPTNPGATLRFQRDYPQGELFSQITGYHSFGLGSTQLERTRSEVLVGTTTEQQLLAIPGLITGEADNAGSVELTLRADLQREARRALGAREGSVVVVDIRTGAVLAMWSYPSFDANLLADNDYDAAFAAMTDYTADPGDPLLANAYMQRYMPGSSFKIITTALGLEAGIIDRESTWPNESEYIPPQTDRPIRNYRGTTCGGDLREVFARSCNIPFAQLAVELGPDAFIDGTARWGIDGTLPIDLPRAAVSTIGPADDLDQNLPLLAMRGFGGNEVQMSPLHMAMVAAAVANDGVMMTPHVVESERDRSGRVLTRTRPEVWATVMSPGDAALMTELMEAVATDGTARCCIALEGGVRVAAKTGTAQLNAEGEPERSHAWIVAFAPADDPRYAVAVMLKGTTEEISAGTGGTLAGPVAKQMLDATLAIDPARQPPAGVRPTGDGEPAGEVGS